MPNVMDLETQIKGNASKNDICERITIFTSNNDIDFLDKQLGKHIGFSNRFYRKI